MDEHLVGERLVGDIRDADGQLLLARATVITERHLELLRQRGYLSVEVTDHLAPEVVSGESLRGEVRQAATLAVRSTLRDIAATQQVPVAAVVRVVDQIVRELAHNPDLALNVNSMRCLDEGLFYHSVNVGVYSVILGLAAGLEPADARCLGVGALLHDVGKVYFMNLVNKPGRLTPDEFQTIQRHAEEGFNLLRHQPGIEPTAAQMAYQHHERLDGSGYPRGLTASTMHPWAKMVAVADIFDTLTADRTYGNAVPRHEAIAELRRMAADHKLDERLVRLLMHRVAAYPNGSILLLESGEVAVVVAQTPDGPSRPLIRVVADAHHHLVPASERQVDSRRPETTIHLVLSDYPPRLREQLPAAEAPAADAEVAPADTAAADALAETTATDTPAADTAAGLAGPPEGPDVPEAASETDLHPLAEV